VKKAEMKFLRHSGV